MIELRVEVVPRWAFRLPSRGGRDGVLRCRGGVLERLLHVDGRPVTVRVAQTGSRSVLFGARARDRGDAERAIARMRFALAVDDDLRDFYERFRDDPLIGPSVRRRPWLRIARRPVAFEALAWAICEQLIDSPRAAAIQRRIVYALGPRCAASGLRDVPSAAALAGCSPGAAWSPSTSRRGARSRSCASPARSPPGASTSTAPTTSTPGGGCSPSRRSGAGRSRCSPRTARAATTCSPAGDLNYLKLLGRWRSGGDPAARAEEAEVRALFERFGAVARARRQARARRAAPARELVAADASRAVRHRGHGAWGAAPATT